MSGTRSPSSVAQWVSEVHKPLHHSMVQSLRDGMSDLVALRTTVIKYFQFVNIFGLMEIGLTSSSQYRLYSHQK